MEKENASPHSGFQPSFALAKTGTRIREKEAIFIHSLARKTYRSGIIVHLGVYGSRSVWCLAEAARACGGKVTAIAHRNQYQGPHGEKSGDNDSTSFLSNTEELRLAAYVEYRNRSSHPETSDLSGNVDFLFVDTNHCEEVVLDDIANWKKSVRVGGAIAIHGAHDRSEVDKAIDETLYKDPAFIEIATMGVGIRAFRKHSGGLQMILCTGLQSGGTTLVSWCFLQRSDMDGRLDMWSEGILLMPYTPTPLAWCKMTISSFRWREVADFYSDQGWSVKPLLVVRDVRAAYASLREKPYGFNGTTAEDPPLRIRFKRFLRDWEDFKCNDWPIIRYESLVSEPEDTLRDCCKQLEIPYSHDMLLWPKASREIDDLGESNDSFQSSLNGQGFADCVTKNKAALQTKGVSEEDLAWLEKHFFSYNKENGYPLHVAPQVPSLAPDRPTFVGTQRHQGSVEGNRLRKEVAQCSARLANCDSQLLQCHRQLSSVLDSKYRKLLRFLRTCFRRLFGRQ